MVQSKYDVQSFLGSCNYYNEFIDNYSIVTKPLTEVLKKPSKDDEIQKFSKTEYLKIKEAMNILKKALTSPPILHLLISVRVLPILIWILITQQSITVLRPSSLKFNRRGQAERE